MISIIIPTFNRKDWLEECLNALAKEVKSEECEIIIVDDGSTDGTVNFLKNFSSERKIKISTYLQERGGPAKARNFGVRMSKSDIVCFLDDDSIVHPNWLDELMKTFKNIDSRYVAVKGKVKAYQNTFLPKFLEEYIHISNSWATNNIAFRKSIFLKAGGFDETFTFAAWEDLDLGFRLERMGYRRFFKSEMIVHHPHEDDLEKLKRKFMINGYGYFQFCRKWISIDPGMVIRMWLERFRVIYYLFPIFKKLDYLRYVHGLRLRYEIIGLIYGILSRSKLKKATKD